MYIIIRTIISDRNLLRVEKDNKAYDSNADQFVEDASQQSHLKYLANKEPYKNEHYDAYEDVKGTRLFHEAIDIEQHHSHHYYVNYVLNSKFYEIHCNLCVLEL